MNGPLWDSGKVQSYVVTTPLKDPWAEPPTFLLSSKACCASLLPEPNGKFTRSTQRGSEWSHPGFTAWEWAKERRQVERMAERPNLDEKAMTRFERWFRTAVWATEAEHFRVCLSVLQRIALPQHTLM